MRKLIHKKWLSIPVTVFLVLVLTAGAVFASTFVGPQNQLIIQKIEDAPVVYDYGSITAPDFRLPGMYTGDTYDIQALQETLVIVDVGEDGVGLYLHVSLAGDVGLYDDYSVGLISLQGSNPMGQLQLVVSKTAPQASIQLTAAGEYTFSMAVIATAGTTEGTANVKVTYTLEDTP